ncbi:hypothetical protein HK098_008330 [Nowakowskiella sp. JEL0407]|nr:hypothetical protein HK098_008330 [Nowakowskiella sp. JEL0407]
MLPLILILLICLQPVLCQQAPRLYFENVTYTNEQSQSCRLNAAISDPITKCRAELIPGRTVAIRWTVPLASDSSADMKLTYFCGPDQTTDKKTLYTNRTIIRVPKCNSMGRTMTVDVCIYQYDSTVTSESDYSLSQKCLHTFVYVDLTGIPNDDTVIQDRSKAAILFGIVFATIMIVWILVMIISYMKNSKIYQDVYKTMETESSSSNFMTLRSEILYRLVHKKQLDDTPPQLKQKMLRFASGFEKVSAVAEEVGKMSVKARNIEFFVNEDFYGRPAQTRIEKMGQSGYSWKMLSLLLPWRLFKIGRSTLTLRNNDQLFLLPKFFTLKVAYRLSIQIITVFVIATGYCIYFFSKSLYRPDTFGTMWIIGGILLFFILNQLKTDHENEKGMLKMLRSIGEPKIPEIMFSYNWGFQKDSIRTLAHALWSSGIGVWIDYIKLISGDKLPQDIRRAAKEVGFNNNITSKKVVNLKKVNLIVVFLTPLYLSSGNCCIEFEEAIKQPGKLHVHVLQWDETVIDALRFLIEDINLPLSKISSHPFVNNKWSFRNLFKKPKSFIYNDTDADRHIQKLEKDGKGWKELAAILHNYSKKDGDSWDFSWWLMNASSGGGIPESAPVPPKVSRWNFRPIFPLSKLPTFYDLRHINGAVKVGNVYLSENCRRTGTDGSAIPWRLIGLIIIALFPLTDVVVFFNAEKDLNLTADLCVKDLQSKINSNETEVIEAVCERFYETSVFRGDGSYQRQTGFSIESVQKAFATLNVGLDCTGVNKPIDELAIEQAAKCVNTLSNWFSNHGYLADRMVWTIMFAMSALFLITIAVNFDSIVNISYKIPACLRPLLAVSNLRRKPVPIRKKLTVFRRNAARDVEIPIDVFSGNNQRTGNNLHQSSLPGPSAMATFQRRLPPIPSLFVKVHGHGLIADNLRTFLQNLDRLLPPDVQCPDLLDVPNAYYTQPVQNAAKIGNEGYAWVNVFVICSQRDLNIFYQLNSAGKVDLEVSVVIVDHQPVPGIVTFEEYRNMNDNILRISEASLWLFTVVFIETRMRDQILGILHDHATPELADQIMVNISLRTKDALFKYGHFFLSALQAH